MIRTGPELKFKNSCLENNLPGAVGRPGDKMSHRAVGNRQLIVQCHQVV